VYYRFRSAMWNGRQRAPTWPPQQEYSGHQIQPFERQQQQDPFAMMDSMMMSPFGGFGGRRGSGGMGMFDDMFGGMGMMMQEMDQMQMGGGRMGGGGGCSSMMMMSSSGGGGGSFSMQTTSFSSRMGGDGQVHTERFSSSAVGDRTRKFHEVQQAYSNSQSGVDKMSLERAMDGRARKMVKERHAESGEERSTQMFRGMTEEQADEFDQHWQSQAAPNLPRHQAGASQMIQGGYPGGTPMQHGRLHQQALPSSSSAGYPEARPSSSQAQYGYRRSATTPFG